MCLSRLSYTKSLAQFTEDFGIKISTMIQMQSMGRPNQCKHLMLEDLNYLIDYLIKHLILNQSPLQPVSLGSLLLPEVDKLLGQVIIMEIIDHTITFSCTRTCTTLIVNACLKMEGGGRV